MREPIVLHFDRAALAVDIGHLQRKVRLLERELAETRATLEEKQNKLNQIAIIAVNRLRKK